MNSEVSVLSRSLESLSLYGWTWVWAVTLLSLVLVFLDHGETWKELCAKSGWGRARPLAKLIALWGLFLCTLALALYSQLEQQVFPPSRYPIAVRIRRPFTSAT
jgi:hypothetical protein